MNIVVLEREREREREEEEELLKKIYIW